MARKLSLLLSYQKMIKKGIFAVFLHAYRFKPIIFRSPFGKQWTFFAKVDSRPFCLIEFP